MTESMTRHARQQRRPLRRAPGRLVVLAVVVLVVIGLAVVDRAVGLPTVAPAPPTADGVPVSPAGSYSSSAFCVGGASGPDGTAGTTLFLTNTSGVAVHGVMTSQVAPGTGSGATSTGTPAAPTTRDVVVPARGQAAVNPGAGLPAGDLATWFGFDGGGVAVNQVVTGTKGWSTAPCASQSSASWYLAGGKTADGDALTLDLYNPSSTASVVNVTFLTSSGVITPSDYQGLSIPAGQLVSENVGDFVQNQQDIATEVSAQSGQVVAAQLQAWSAGTSGLGLSLGSPDTSTAWYLPQSTDGAGSVTFHLANPGTAPTVATLTFGLPMAHVAPVSIALPPQSVTTWSPSSTGHLPRQTAYATTIRATSGIVVSRMVDAGSAAAPATAKGGGPATSTLATHWLVPAPGVPNAPGTPGATVDSLAVADPHTVSTRVVVTEADSGAVVAAFTVAAGSLVVLGPSAVGGLRALDVRSTHPVALEEDAGPSGAPGVVFSTGMSFRSGPS
jgi:hypothetical protein